MVRHLVLECGHQFAGFVDDWNTGGEVIGPFEQAKATLSPGRFEFALAIGYRDLKARWTVYERLKSNGYGLATLVHPKAFVDGTATLGEGCMVMSGANVDLNVRLGSVCVLWPSSVVSHDAVLGHNIFISPNATICGYAMVGDNCFLGAGSTVTDHVRVPDASFVKAGAVFSTRQ